MYGTIYRWMVIHQCIEMVNHSRSSSLNSCSPTPYRAVNFCPEIETLATVPSYMAVSIYVLMPRYHTFNIIHTLPNHTWLENYKCMLSLKIDFLKKNICADFVHAFNQPKKPASKAWSDSDIVQLSTSKVPTTTSGVTAEERLKNHKAKLESSPSPPRGEYLSPKN